MPSTPQRRGAPRVRVSPAGDSRWPDLDGASIEAGRGAAADDGTLPGEGRWPELGRWADHDATLTPIEASTAMERERLRRLDREQRGH